MFPFCSPGNFTHKSLPYQKLEINHSVLKKKTKNKRCSQIHRGTEQDAHNSFNFCEKTLRHTTFCFNHTDGTKGYS